ncbi:MAG: hypothetical protein R3B47_11590 [Bacteroidia bacterium]
MNRTLFFCFSAFALFICACGGKGEYSRMIEEGLASGQRNDSIFIGMYFGMSRKDFFAHCWELNKDSLIRQGPGNLSVQYDLEGEFSEAAWMNFYPDFFEEKIWNMPVQFRYKTWAPWNRRLFNDSLIVRDVIPWAEKKYGKGFRKFEHPEKPPVWASVDGNRLIYIRKKKDDEQVAEMFITDLNVKQQIDPIE